MKTFIVALQFLTIIPVKSETTENGLVSGIALFPVIGLLQGAALAGTAYLLSYILPPDVTCAIVLLALVVSNGGFHLDGLSDTFDALAKRGSTSEKLLVMKDSRVGAIGVTAIALSILIKYLLLASISESTSFYLFLLLMPVLSKWAMVVSMYHGKPAKADGLGSIFIKGATTLRALAATVMTAAIAFSLFYFAANEMFFAATSMAVVYIAGFLFAKFFIRQFGGHTGDTVGATGEISELIYLLTALIWQRNYIS